MHHQFLDGGTGSNPNLLSNVNINANLANQLAPQPHMAGGQQPKSGGLPGSQHYQQRPEYNQHQSHSQLPSKYVKSSHELLPDSQ